MFRRGVSAIVVGLGNPGKKYEQTRHNTGFMALDFIAKENGVSLKRSRFSSLCGTGRIGGREVLLMKPTTYMNLSGEAVAAAARFYKIEPSDVVVIFDDVALKTGDLRIKKNGSAGGHNGIESIIDYLGSEFPRIKIGTGLHLYGELADYVLSRFPSEQLAAVQGRFADAQQALTLILQGKTDEAQSKFN